MRDHCAYVLPSVLYALCFMLYALCFMLYALCLVPYTDALLYSFFGSFLCDLVLFVSVILP